MSWPVIDSAKEATMLFRWAFPRCASACPRDVFVRMLLPLRVAMEAVKDGEQADPTGEPERRVAVSGNRAAQFASLISQIEVDEQMIGFGCWG